LSPYPNVQENIGAGGMLHELAKSTGKRLVFHCAFGEGSAGVGAGRAECRAFVGLPYPRGLDAWKKAAGPLTP